MKDGLKYKNDLAKELATLDLTNQLQIINLTSQLSIKEMKASDSLSRVGAKTVVSVQVYDVTGNTADMSGFSVSVNQNGVLKTSTTPVSGLVVFPDFITGSASIVVSKTGFARASGIMNITSSGLQTKQQAVMVPVFPTAASTAKVSGVLTAQLDLTTGAKEPVKDGVVSLNFSTLSNIFDNPNSNLPSAYAGLIGLVYDGDLLQPVKTGADGKYSFNVPKTKLDIEYKLGVSTMQKKQKLLFGDYPNPLDSMRVDSMPTYFGYWPSSTSALNDFIGYHYNGSSGTTFPGLNLKIDAPAGANTPTAAANIDWVHNDSTLVTWSFTKFNYTNGGNEYTKITQAPKFVFSPNLSLVTVVTPTAAVVDITGGKLNSLYMTNGGLYLEYGRNTGWIIPRTFGNPQFKFFEQLSAEDVHGVVVGDTTYQTAKASTGAPVLKAGRVKIPITMTRKGVGYTSNPNFEITVRLNTAPSTDLSDSVYVLTQADLKGMTLSGGKITCDSLVLPTVFKTAAQVSFIGSPIISTAKYNSTWMTEVSYVAVTATASNTYKVDLLNGLKIADGGLGYPTAPSISIQNQAFKQGTTNGYTLQTIATAATTIDGQGRIISIADPVMLDNFVISYNWNGSAEVFAYDMSSSYPQYVTVPADVPGKTQAYARAMVNNDGSITDVVLWNEDYNNSWWDGFEYLYSNWWNSSYSGSYYYSGKGYLSTPKITVTPVGLTTVAKPAVLKALVNSAGRIYNILIVDPGKGYTFTNDPKALISPDDLVNLIKTNGASDFVYDIDLGSGYHGKAVNVFNYSY
jgi:hypothetical protein